MAMNKVKKILTVGKNVPWIASQRGISAIKESYYEEDHKQMQSTLRKIIDADINPHVDQWEQEGTKLSWSTIQGLLGSYYFAATKAMKATAKASKKVPILSAVPLCVCLICMV